MGKGETRQTLHDRLRGVRPLLTLARRWNKSGRRFGRG
jgi:hypothetical protein